MIKQSSSPYPSAENIQAKPALPPKPRFSEHPQKLKVAPRPGEAKQNLILNKVDLSSISKLNYSNIPLNPVSSYESSHSSQTSKETISSESIHSAGIVERHITISDLSLENKDQLNDNFENQSEIITSTSSEQSTHRHFSTHDYIPFKSTNSAETDNLDSISQKKRSSSHSVPHFSQINVQPPSFKFRQFKYPSGNLSGTVNFPDFDEKLNEMMQRHLGPRIQIAKSKS